MPHRLVRRLQWGEMEEILEDPGLWSCVGCGTCGLRCPNDIAVDKVVDLLREQALAEKTGPKNRTRAFHENFLSTVRSFGRAHELTLTAKFKMATMDLFSDLDSGLSMFLKGKIPVMPSIIKEVDEIRRLFSAAEGGNEEHE